MLEPAVTLTDYGLTIECWILAALIARQPTTAMSRWWIVFFTSIGAASLLGGTVHGFLPDRSSFMHQAVWDANLMAIGVTAIATWNLAAMLTKSDVLKDWMPWVSAILFITFVLRVFAQGRNEFVQAIAMYLPAAVFLTITMSVAFFRDQQRGWKLGIVGLLLTFVAAAAQQLRFALHPVYFDHNALYHAIQAVALFLLYYAQKGVARTATAA